MLYMFSRCRKRTNWLQALYCRLLIASTFHGESNWLPARSFLEVSDRPLPPSLLIANMLKLEVTHAGILHLEDNLLDGGQC
jgi:hypothetical protein